MNTVGIDFGTTTTLVACWNEADRRSDFVHLGRSGPELPTTVHVDKERQLLFGDDADDELALDPGGYQRRIKLGLGTSRKFLLNGHEFTAVDLCAKFLEHVHHRIKEEHLHGKLDRVVIGVPAKFGPAARHDLETAAKQAGFVDFELIEEPVAAGIAFLEEKKGSDLGNEILVFDWGGGTLDIALVERRGDEWILNHDHLEGDLELGGEDIDDSMMAVAEDRLLQNGHSAVTDAYDRDYSQIYRRVVETKKLLSKKGSHSFNHATGNCQFSFACSREEFESVIIKQTTQAMQCVVRWKERAGEKGQSIRNVLLVGGTSQIPVVSRYLKDLGMNPIPWTHGMHAVALGAALRAKRERTLVEKAEAGDVEAMGRLGIELLKGVRSDPEAAFEWFERAAEGGSLAGMNWAGECLIKGIGTTQNPYLASDYFRKSALAGNVEAMVRLGVCLTDGVTGETGKPEGVIWIRKAAELGFPEGMYRLGKLLLSSGDREMGERWLRDAAAAGHENALLEIAQLPVIKKSDSSSNSPPPQGVQKSPPGGQVKSPDQNITPSENAIQDKENNDEIISPFFVLRVIVIILLWAVGVGVVGLPILIAVLGTGAIVYSFGRETDISLTFANLLSERAAGKEHGAEKKKLEKGSEAKKHSEAANEARAKVSYLKAEAEGGDVEAMVKLAMSYMNGDGVECDSEEAFRWFYKAAESGNSEGMYQVGKCYAFGRGTDRNSTFATLWFERAAQEGHGAANKEFKNSSEAKKHSDAINEARAKVSSLKPEAEAGNVDAMFKLAMCYTNGDGVEKNLSRAFEWFCNASNAGHSDGMIWAGHFLKNGIGTASNLRLAIGQFRKSALTGNAEGMVRFGVCLVQGAAGKSGKLEGESWIQKSAELYCPEGMYRFGYSLISSGEKGRGMRWIRGAAEAGHEVGKAFLERCGKKYSIDEAFLRFHEAADAGDPEGMYQLSKFYRFGSGTKKNLDLAARWLEKAAIAGHGAAIQEKSGENRSSGMRGCIWVAIGLFLGYLFWLCLLFLISGNTDLPNGR